MNDVRKEKIKHYLFLHAVLLFYAAMSIISKLAAPYEMLSWQFIALYGLKMVALFVYAILWQQVLKHFDLTTAFANKAIAVVWGLVLGVLFFEETLTWTKVIGSLVIMAGIVIAVKEDGEDAAAAQGSGKIADTAAVQGSAKAMDTAKTQEMAVMQHE